MAAEEVPVLRREAIVPTSDRGRLAAIVATCSLAGLAGGMALSMLAETHRAAREMRGTRYHSRVSGAPLPWLGVKVSDARPHACTGTVVKEITSHGPADRVGFHTGDLIVSFDGERICSNDHLIEMVRASAIGSTPQLEVRRGRATVTLSPTLGEMPPGIRNALPPEQLR